MFAIWRGRLHHLSRWLVCLFTYDDGMRGKTYARWARKARPKPELVYIVLIEPYKKRVNAKDHLAYDALALHTQRSQHVRYIPPDDDVLYRTRFAYITHSAEHKCNYIRLRNQTDFSKQTTSCNTSEENYKYSNIRTHTYIVPESAADGVQALQIEIAYDHREQRVNAIS